MIRAWLAFSASLFFVALSGSNANADVWVFEPSITLDQRIDDNYFLLQTGGDTLSATRAVGELSLNRESQTYVLRGSARIDALLTGNTDVGEEELDSNQIATIDLRKRTTRSRYGFELFFKRDTPSRDIAADISSDASLAEDTGLLSTQTLSSNVARQEITFEPSFSYDITRRLEFDVSAGFSAVEHELPSVQNVIYQRYLDDFARLTQSDNPPEGPPLPFDQVTLNDIPGGVITPDGELDDFNELGFDVGLRYKLDRVSTLTFTGQYSRLSSNVTINRNVVVVPFEALIPDPRENGIRRVPRRESISTTTTVRLGFERFVTPTLQLGIQGGVYSNAQDNSDLLRPEELIEGANPELTVPKTDSDGWLANVSFRYDADATQFNGSFAVDVEPSSAGTQVETNELKGVVTHAVNPRLNIGLRASAFEPDRLGARVNDSFARRFISFEPLVQWQYTRNWTFAASYRYRRQKARIEPMSAESNAVLFAVRYTPASKVRDAARASGL